MEEELVSRTGIPFTAIPAAGVAGVGGRALPGNLWKLGRGCFAARKIIRDFRPDVIFFTGGYLAVPVAFAARLPLPGISRPRIVLYSPDIEPGMALKRLAPAADHITVTVEQSRAYLPDRKRVTVTGYPVRSNLQPWEPEAARRAFDLRNDLPVLLVLGGSRGARQVNRSVLKALPGLLEHMQVLHVSGRLDWPEVQEQAGSIKTAIDPQAAGRYHAMPFLYDDMGAALTASDLVLSRAGASILGELPLFGLPAVLVPYPHAGRYQKVNAQYLEEKGAAAIIIEEDLDERLLPVVLGLMRDHSGRERMSQVMRSLAKPDAARAISDVLIREAQAVPGKGRQSW
jgi:UDP-N-acetylglucosamine--N-acetylmuramyl-(pentapeptide) pyrophosphoryl-undecaprenol N-acetylglucosamine transferase